MLTTPKIYQVSLQAQNIYDNQVEDQVQHDTFDCFASILLYATISRSQELSITLFTINCKKGR